MFLRDGFIFWRFCSRFTVQPPGIQKEQHDFKETKLKLEEVNKFNATGAQFTFRFKVASAVGERSEAVELLYYSRCKKTNKQKKDICKKNKAAEGLSAHTVQLSALQSRAVIAHIMNTRQILTHRTLTCLNKTETESWFFQDPVKHLITHSLCGPVPAGPCGVVRLLWLFQFILFELC